MWIDTACSRRRRQCGSESHSWTSNPARVLGKEADVGTIAQGKNADLVLLDANPLDDVRNTRRIAAVIFGGKLYRRADLDSLLRMGAELADKN